MHSLPPSPSLRPLLGALCAAGMLSACDVTIKDGDVSFKELHGRATQEWSRTYPLAAGGTVAITNANGPVEVGAGASGRVEIGATISARAMTDQRARELLSGTLIEEKVAPDRVEAATPRGERRGRVSVSYTVRVPTDARVEVTVNNGSVKANGLGGHVQTMVVNGGVELAGLRGSVNGPVSVKMAEVTSRVRLEGTNGSITLEIPKDAKALLSARSINGGIRVNGLATGEASGRRIRNLESILNGGGPEIDVRMTNGAITIEGR